MVSISFPKRLPLALSLYVAGVFVVTAGACIWPFATPMIVVFWAWLSLFFLFAIVVLPWALWHIAVAYYRLLSGIVHDRRLARKARVRSEAAGAMGLWDRWLDG